MLLIFFTSAVGAAWGVKLNIQITSTGQKLVFWGAVLFLVGLLQGGLVPYFTSPRLALSAHLGALQSGMALVIFGLIWPLIVLKDTWLRTAYYSLITSLYLIFLGNTLAASLGASKALPIAGAGFAASVGGELLVQVIMFVAAGLIVIGVLVVVCGLYKGLKSDTNKTPERHIR